MPIQGFTGISHPFRVGGKGGVALSTTDVEDVAHINESIRQILSTRRLERSMEYHIYSELDEQIFEPNDTTTHTLIEYNIRECLRLEPRIEVRTVTLTADENFVYADIYYLVLVYQKYYNTGNIKIGTRLTGGEKL